VDLLTIKELGGWKTLAMVMRYSHLSPGRLQEGVERLVRVPAPTSQAARAEASDPGSDPRTPQLSGVPCSRYYDGW
jgi:hypothetical protein